MVQGWARVPEKHEMTIFCDFVFLRNTVLADGHHWGTRALGGEGRGESRPVPPPASARVVGRVPPRGGGPASRITLAQIKNHEK